MSTTTHTNTAETSVQKHPLDDSGKGVKEKATETAQQARDYAAEKAQAASKAAEATALEVRDNVVKASDAARDFATKQPLATAAGALVLGVLVGMALNQRR